MAAFALVPLLAVPVAHADRADSASAGLSRDEWDQIQRVLGTPGPTFLQDAKLDGHGDPGVGSSGADAGYSVAVSGDTALVGAPRAGLGFFPLGSAFVFVRSAGIWSLQQELLPSDAAAARILPSGPTYLFGASVALAGDTAVVGAPGTNVYAAYVFTRVGTTWHEEQKLLPSGASPVPFFGGSVSLSGDTLVVGANGGVPLGWVEGAAYVFVRSGTVWSEQQKLVASDGAEDAYFGTSVSLDGDTAVVGAPFADTPAGGDAGSAYVFVRSGTAWSEQQKLAAPDGEAFDHFGDSVSVSGDTVGVGASAGDTPGGADSGSAYVFVRSGTAWTEQQKLMASDGAVGDSFGFSVSVSGDTAGVGAYRDDTPGGTDSGSAYVFVRTGTIWTEQQKLTASDAAGDQHLGYSVSIDGDTGLAGAPDDRPVAGIQAGSAYAFVRSGAIWNQEQKLVGPDPTYYDQMGLSVSVSGDTAVVGAPSDNTAGGWSAGSVYVFVRSGTAWIEEQKLTASDGALGDRFGAAVCISDDTLAVGAPYADTASGADAGAAYVFVRSGTVWSAQQKLTASDGAGEDFFGSAVSVSGDTTLVGDGRHDTAGGVDAGAAYVFVRSGTAWTEQQQLTASDGAGGNYFGFSVSASGDTALVGAPLAGPPGVFKAGAAYAFVRSGTAWTEQQKLTASDAAPFMYLGVSVSLSGDTALAGAPSTATETGAAYAFLRSGSVWSEQQKLTASDGGAGDQFSWSVSVSGDTALVGAQYADTAGGTDAGAAYVFVRSGTVWTAGQKLMASDAVANEFFGASVALSGEIALLGSPGNVDFQNPTPNTAYVFRPHSADLSVTKTDAQASAVPGSQVTYSILVGNAGPDNVSGASMSDALPSILTDGSWTCAASPGSSCGASGIGGISDLVDLLVGGSATYTLTARIDPAALGTLDNAASVSVPAPVTDPNAVNDSALDSDTLTPEADLRLVLSDLPDPAGAGGLLTYTVQATNLGPSVSSGMALSDTLPPELVSAEAIPGPPACTVAGGTVACNLPGLSPGESRNVTIRGLVSGAQGVVLSNSASVSGNETDPAAGNDSDTELTAVGAKAEADLVHGATIVGNLESAGGAPDEDLFRINQLPYSSYEVIVDGTSGDIGSGSGPDLDRLASDATTLLQSSVPAGAGASRSLRWENDTAASVSGEYLRVRSAGCTTTCDAADVYRIRSFDTTMLVPRFNNGGSQITILVLQNTSGAPLSGHASFWNGSGALVANLAFTLAPRAVFTVNSSTVPGAAGQAGSITVSHDGSYGALDGKAVAVEPATGFTFDTALEPRAR